MTKRNRVVGTVAVSSALLLVIGLALPSRVRAQTPGQGHAVGLLLLLGLGPRPVARPPVEEKTPGGVVKSVARHGGKLVRLTYDYLNGRMVVRSVEVTEGPRVKQN
jgi:hypothetical protein